jgi:hypothetical protein
VTREERLNNPGGIKHSSTTWRGQSPEQPDVDFVKFVSPVWGIRAIARTLETYQQEDDVRTLREAIERWAPPTENDTAAYIIDVCGECSVHPDDPMDLSAVLPMLVKAIIRHENGEVIYTDEQIREAIGLV